MGYFKLLKNIKSSLRAIREWGSTSSFHGIPNLSKAQHLAIRIVWLACFLMALAYLCWAFVNSAIAFFQYDVNTVISYERKESIEFPTVMVCNIALVKFPHLDLYSGYLNIQFAYAMSWLMSNLTTMSVMISLDYWNMLSGIQQNFTAANYSFFTHSLDEMLINCHFNDQPCTVNDFERIFSYSTGNCYKFNSGKYANGTSYPLRHVSTPGRRNGLSLELYSGNLSVYYDFIRSSGILVFIQNSSTFSLANLEGVFLANSFETDIVIQQSFLNKLPAPYSDCIVSVDSINAFDSSLYRSTVELIGTYSQKYCLQLCLQKYVMQSCQCYDVTLPSFNLSSVPVCDLTFLGTCIYPAYVRFYEANLVADCFNYCPDECNSVYFNYELSFSDFPSPYYLQLLQRYNQLHPNVEREFSSFEAIKSSVLAANIYFDDLTYTMVQEEPKMTGDQFFANVGGLLGISIGTSLMMFVELAELVFWAVYRFFKPVQES